MQSFETKQKKIIFHLNDIIVKKTFFKNNYDQHS